MSFGVFIFLTQWLTVDCFYTHLLKNRPHRHCHESSTPHSVVVLNESKFGVCMVFISGLLFVLVVLGFIKGLLGLCSHKIGIYGLNLFIDLPRPLSRYEEKNLLRRTVVYDVGGWPVHPDTLKRTVRVLPKRTEFCLNLVFFLGYPLAAAVYICAFCCCIRNLRSSDENTCFKHVDVIRLTNHDSKNKNGLDVYKEGNKEEQDTKYVVEAMKQSKESIQEYRKNVNRCFCAD